MCVRACVCVRDTDSVCGWVRVGMCVVVCVFVCVWGGAGGGGACEKNEYLFIL